ncbi:MAG TPA: beta-N-acetylhexosaminidase [Polyangiaceae bacterium]
MSSLEAAAARLVTVGFPGKALDPELERLLDRGVGGIILFKRNVGSPEEVAELVRAAKRRAGRPLLATIDQEGGPVARLREGFTRIPPMRALGATRDPELARDVGRVMARELAAVGIDLDFAPVLDVDTNPQNPVIGARSFGPDAENVASLGAALARGMIEGGVAPCGKHFPGHGDTHQDSHHELPRVLHGLERLRAVELVPFATAVRADFPALMTAHVVMEGLDAETPATMSAAVVGGILREELGFRGVVFTDDVDMRAIADHFDVSEVAASCLSAGVDAFLCCQSVEVAHRMIDAIVAAVRSGAVPEQRLAEAYERVRKLAERWAKPPLEAFDLTALDSPAHRAVISRIPAG